MRVWRGCCLFSALGWPLVTAFLGPAPSRLLPSRAPPTSSRATAIGRKAISLQSELVPDFGGIEKLMEGRWAQVPSDLDEITREAQASLAGAIESGEKRFRIDIRTPGLEDQFEQTAIRDKALLLGVLGGFFPVLEGIKTKVLFQSEGEAAMAAKAFARGDWDLPETMSFAGLSPSAVQPDDQLVFLVEPANRPGDPVILKVEEIVEKAPDATLVMFNPDLEIKGSAPGIRERDRRQAFLDSFKSAYVYIALASLSRPALIPRELGALHYVWGGAYRLLRCIMADNGPGSLNRFMKRTIYEMTPMTPTARNPPKFFLLEQYESRPKQEQLSSAMGRAEDILEGMIKTVSEAVDTAEKARDILVDASSTRDVDPERVLKAISFLEKSSRKGGEKDPEEEEEEAKELLAKINGDWKLIFTTGTKSTQSAIGSIDYFPVRAVQKFNAATKDYSNNVYLFNYPVIQVKGTFDCPKKNRLSFIVQSIALGPIPFSFKGDGFFTFFWVDDKIAVARGQGGGLALWAKEA